MTDRDRIPCCVPFCRRTVHRLKHPGALEVICAPHWRLADKRLRGLHHRVRRRIIAGKSRSNMADAYLWVRIWDRLKAQIITASTPC